MTADGKIFEYDTIDADVNKIRSGIKAPFVNAHASSLGGKERVSILMVISLDDKSTWSNNILENSRYFRLHFYNDGTLESFSGYGLAKRFRKTRVKSVDEAIKKINTFIASQPIGEIMDDKRIAIELLKVARELSVPERHQKAIALKTLKMNDVGVAVMGGMNKEEAREFLKSIGYSDAQVRRLEASERTAADRASKLTLSVSGDNDAFEDNPMGEYARILENAANMLRHGVRHSRLLDVNGNLVGKFEVK